MWKEGQLYFSSQGYSLKDISTNHFCSLNDHTSDLYLHFKAGENLIIQVLICYGCKNTISPLLYSCYIHEKTTRLPSQSLLKRNSCSECKWAISLTLLYLERPETTPGHCSLLPVATPCLFLQRHLVYYRTSPLSHHYSKSDIFVCVQNCGKEQDIQGKRGQIFLNTGIKELQSGTKGNAKKNANESKILC